MSRTPLVGLSATALVATLALAGCSGGSDDPDGAGSAGTSASPSAPPRPPVATLADAKKVVQGYQRRNNAAIRKARKPPYSAKAWRAVDGGPVLASDRFSTAEFKNGYREQAAGRVFFDDVARLYAPLPPAGGPQWFMVAMRERSRTKGHTSKGPVLSLFERPRSGARWKHTMIVGLKAGDRPRSAEPGSAATPAAATIRRAARLARQVGAFWNHGRRPRAFAPSRMLTDTLKVESYQTLAIRAALLGGTSGVRAVAVEHGTLVLAPFRLVQTYRARTGTIHWTEGSAAVLGSGEHTTLTRHEVGTVAFLMPNASAKGRKARILSINSDAAIW